MKSGPIIIVEDDADDRDVFGDIIKELEIPNPIIWFKECNEALDYLNQTTEQPFIIFCDVNIPPLTGIEFKRKIDNDPHLRKKSIPFVFYSTSVDQRTINEAYTQMTVQGFFQKENSYSEVKKTVKLILDYWSDCLHPNTK
jgi:CheY-like chemotaxis protein